MKKIIAFLLFTTNIIANDLDVETLDEQPYSDNLTVLRFRIHNYQNDTYNNVSLKYCLNRVTSENIVLDEYYIDSASIELQNLDSIHTCINISFNSISGEYFPNTDGFCIGIHNEEWTARNKKTDYSYLETSQFQKNEKVSLYIGDSLVSGTTITSPVNNITAKFTLIQPENTVSEAAFFEIKNLGDTVIDADSLFISSFVESKKILSSNLAVGDSIKVYLSEFSSLNAIAPQGELFLYYGNKIIDYIAWGNCGQHASIAIESGVWHSETDFLKTQLDSSQNLFSQKKAYDAGSFYRRFDVNQYSSQAWLLYSENEREIYVSNLPTPTPISLADNTTIHLSENDSANFSWNIDKRANSYRLTILRKDSSLYIQKDLSANSINLKLPEGDYLWNVQAVAPGSFFSHLKKLTYIFIHISKAIIKNKVVLGVPSLDTRRDTKLLNISWGEHIEKFGWDEVHPPLNPTTRSYDYDESVRCWAVAIRMLNHYFYKKHNGTEGTLTLDEIIAHVGIWGTKNKNSMSPALGALRAGNTLNDGIHYDGIFEGIGWSLGISRPINYTRFASDQSDVHSTIKREIDAGKPLYVVQCNAALNSLGYCPSSTHAMVIDGYQRDEEGTYSYHFLNVDNYGTEQWRTISSAFWNPLILYIPYNEPNGSDVLGIDPDVLNDDDNDGIVNYDEKYRFDSSPNNDDTDGDNIKDKVEIYSYVIREKFPTAFGSGTGVITEKYADINKNNKRAENDKDSDSDGFDDDREDANRNGTFESWESDPYDINSTPRESFLPNGIAIYSLDYVRINDGVQCLETASGTKTYCDIASYSSDYSNAVIIGARAKLGNIYSKGCTTLRSHAMVLNIGYYGLPLQECHTTIQNGATFSSEKNFLSTDMLNLTINNNFPQNEAKTEIVVSNGMTKSLNSNTNLKKLKVESNGELVIHPGEYVIDELQLDANSKITFADPGQSVIFHVKKIVTWHPTISTTANLNAIAKGVKLYYYGSERLFVEGQWAGTLIAPNAKLVLGQTRNKTLYGQFVGNGIAIHQYSKVYNIPFNPTHSSIYAFRRH